MFVVSYENYHKIIDICPDKSRTIYQQLCYGTRFCNFEWLSNNAWRAEKLFDIPVDFVSIFNKYDNREKLSNCNLTMTMYRQLYP